MDHIEKFNIMVLKGIITPEQASKAINQNMNEHVDNVDDSHVATYTDEEVAEFEKITEELNDLLE